MNIERAMKFSVKLIELPELLTVYMFGNTDQLVER